MKKSAQLFIAFLLTGLALIACKQATDTGGASSDAGSVAAQSAPVSIAAVEAEARGFTVGSPISVRSVYVFFDPQCPHCAALWEAAKPLKSQAKFIWIPVGILNKTSEIQGAALLAAKDPVAAMDAHEASMAAKTGGITPSGDVEQQKAIVAKNTALMNRFGFASIPTIVAAHAQTGALVTHEGALPTPELAQLLGLQVPSRQ
jgi:thiol:disulfide interchange protein DsbG